MRLRIRDVEIAAKCTGETFSLMGDDGVECFEGVDSFNYLGRVLHLSYKDWLAVFQIIGRERQVWGDLGKFLRREEAYLIVSAKFYRAVVQAVILFWAETWVLTETMLQKLEGVHMGFLWQVAGMTARKLGVGTWQKEGVDRVIQDTGKNPFWEYTERRQATVAEWVSLRPIF